MILRRNSVEDKKQVSVKPYVFLQIAVQLLRILQYLKTQEITHKNIKPT